MIYTQIVNIKIQGFFPMHQTHCKTKSLLQNKQNKTKKKALWPVWDIYIKPDLFGIFYPFWEIGFNLFKDLQICGGAKSLQKLYVNIVSLPKKGEYFLCFGEYSFNLDIPWGNIQQKLIT